MTDHSNDVVVYANRTLTPTTIIYDAYLPAQALLRGMRAIGPFDYSEAVEVMTPAPAAVRPG